MLYREYDTETLERLQSLELEILKDFTDLCEKNSIDYFGVGGTAIGLMRYQGFIPWDDDIDVGLTRENYDKFIKVAQRDYADKYYIVNAETEPAYPLMSTRWCLRGSKFKEECFKNLGVDLGIFLDIYCFDNIPDDEKKMRRQGFWAWFWGKLMILRAIDKPTLYFGGFAAKMVYLASFMIHHLMKLFHISPQFLYRQAKKHATKYQGEATSRVAYCFDPQLYTSIIDRKDIVPTKLYNYNGLQVRFPGRVERYLEKRYGDYMTPPPEDKRHNHPPYELEFPQKG